MCGIAGIYGVGMQDDRELTLREMLRLIRHRGPNEAGMYFSNRLGMGTVRLSIVDIASGQQPMCDESERFVLCYNGETYNYIELRKELRALGYRFLTESDTEVVLHAWRAWGPDCLQRLNGGFAFALYDRVEDELYLVRDRFGKRPLYYAHHNGDLLFGSEMKSFLGLESFRFEFDPSQLASILVLWTPIADQSAYRGIHQVPPGSFAKVRNGSVSVQRYFQPDFRSTRDIRSLEEAVESVATELRKSVQLRLRSDVEVGMYLSGGLDSSILAGILADQVNRGFRTYSVAFADSRFDESADQLRMAAHVGSKHTALQVTDAMIADSFPAAAFHAEVPVFRTALVPMYLLSRMVRDDGIKVVMTGEGADEAFLGYDLFKETLLRRAWHSLDEHTKLERLRLLHPYLQHYSEANQAELLGLYQQFSTEQYPGLFSHELRIQNGLFSKRLLKGRADSFEAIHRLMTDHSYFADLSPTQRAQWLEYQSLLPGYLLSSQGDRMALAHSVENRCPYLDPGLADIAAAVNLKFDDGNDEKVLLRKAFADRLPAENMRKRKHPYRAPDAQAFASRRPDYLDLLLSESELRKNDFLNPSFCRLLAQRVLDQPGVEVSTKENQTFVFLLSIALQQHQFVHRNFSGADANPPIDDILTTIIDRRPQKTRALAH